MLGRLARYLRAAGYDTSLASGGLPDREWLIQARSEVRYFLTLDREILQHRAAKDVAVLLPHGDLDELAHMLSERFHVDWLAHAFTRCLVDNALLVPASDDDRRDLPAIASNTLIMKCPHCRRVYWAGSHYRRMMARMTRWQRGEWNL